MTVHSPDLALRATGLLAELNAAGVLSAADVHVAQRLGALVRETDERVLLAAALTVRSTRAGSVVVDLATVAATVVPDADEALAGTLPEPVELPWPEVGQWVAACSGSPLTSGPDAPLRQRGSRLWLARYDAQEQQVVDELRRRTATLPDDLDLARLGRSLDRLFPGTTDTDQRLAAAVCALSRVSVLAGGPGTGKTTTVSRVLAVLTEQHPTWRVALAAPTGKAAARLEEAVRSSAAGFASTEDARHVQQLTGVTLHRLLGWRPGSRSRFRHDATNRLPVEVVVVDEASMVPLTMMARLLEALREGTRLVLVGDPDQLASVEAGAVLGDLVDRTRLGVRTPLMAAALDAVAPGASLHGRSADGGTSTVDTTEGPTAATAHTGGQTAGRPSRPTADAPTTDAPTTDRPTPAQRVRDGIAVLRVNHRFAAGSAIGELADAVRAGDVARAVDLLRSGGEGVTLLEVGDDEPLTSELLGPVEEDVRRWGAALRRAALDGDPVGGARGAGHAPAALRPPPRPPGRAALGALRRPVAGRGQPRPPGPGPAGGRAPPRGAAAGHDERLRGQPVQRGHRRRRGGRQRRDAGLVRARRRAHVRAAGPARRRATRPRHDRPPQPGLAVRPGHRRAAHGRLPPGHPGDALHGHHPGGRPRPGRRVGGGLRRRRGPARRPGHRPAGTPVDRRPGPGRMRA